MEVNIKRLNDAYHFQATNDSGNIINMDGSPEIGGENKGFRPMQTLLGALGGCSAIDVVMILKKQKEPLEDIDIKITGERYGDRIPKTFKAIHLHYILKGKINKDKAARAVELSMEKYCSVGMMLKAAAEITYGFEIVE